MFDNFSNLDEKQRKKSSNFDYESLLPKNKDENGFISTDPDAGEGVNK